MFFEFLLWAEPKLYIFTLCILGILIEPTRGIIYSGTSNKKVSKKNLKKCLKKELNNFSW